MITPETEKGTSTKDFCYKQFDLNLKISLFKESLLEEEREDDIFVTIFDPLEDPIDWRWEDFIPGYTYRY